MTYEEYGVWLERHVADCPDGEGRSMLKMCLANFKDCHAKQGEVEEGLKHSPLPWKIKDSDQGSAFLVDVNNKPIIKQKPATYDEEGGWEYNDDDIKFIVDCCNSRHLASTARIKEPALKLWIENELKHIEIKGPFQDGLIYAYQNILEKMDT